MAIFLLILSLMLHCLRMLKKLVSRALHEHIQGALHLSSHLACKYHWCPVHHVIMFYNIIYKQMQGIATMWPLSNYTTRWQRHMCVNNLPTSCGAWCGMAWNWNCNHLNVSPRASCLINLWAFCHFPWICSYINLLISWVRSFTESYLPYMDNIAPFEKKHSD